MKSRGLAALTAAAFLAFAAIGSSADRAEAHRYWRGPAAGPASADVYRYAYPRRYYYRGGYYSGYRGGYYSGTTRYVDGLGYYGPYRPYYRRHPYYRHIEHRRY